MYTRNVFFAHSSSTLLYAVPPLSRVVVWRICPNQVFDNSMVILRSPFSLQISILFLHLEKWITAVWRMEIVLGSFSLFFGISPIVFHVSLCCCFPFFLFVPCPLCIPFRTHFGFSNCGLPCSTGLHTLLPIRSSLTDSFSLDEIRHRCAPLVYSCWRPFLFTI